MINSLKTIENLLVFSLTGPITAADIDAIYDMMEKKLASSDIVNLYGEMLGDFEVEGGAMLKDISRAHEVLGKMKHFDRIAFVASESWMRAIAKIEAAAFSLTGVNMQVYDASECTHALAWAKGDVEDAHEASVREVGTRDENVIAFEIDGKMRKSDLTEIWQIIDGLKGNVAPNAMLARIRNFKGFELSLLADKKLFSMKKDAIGKLQRYAIVGAPEWLQTVINTTGKPLDVDIRTFGVDDEDDAWNWLQSKNAA